VPKQTVSEIIKNKSDFLQKLEHIPTTHLEKTTKIHSPLWSELDATVGKWVLHQVQRRVSLSRSLILGHAKKVHEAICLRIQNDPTYHFETNTKAHQEHQKFLGFCGSRGWFAGFKQRSDLRHVKIRGESANADHEEAEMFITNLKCYIDNIGYDPRQIFNVDETGLMWQKSPNSTYIPTSFAHPEGFKLEKKRVTLLFGGNAFGDKFKPLCLNQFKQPRAFERINPEDLGVYWASNKRAWMTAAAFKDWFQRCFVPEVTAYLEAEGLENKVLLLVDNAPGHPLDLAEDYPNIEMMYLPPNTTSLIQPMDQGIIRSFKANYLKAFMTSIASEDTNDDYLTSVKQFNIRDCVLACVDAWYSIHY